MASDPDSCKPQHARTHNQCEWRMEDHNACAHTSQTCACSWVNAARSRSNAMRRVKSRLRDRPSCTIGVDKREGGGRALKDITLHNGCQQLTDSSRAQAHKSQPTYPFLAEKGRHVGEVGLRCGRTNETRNGHRVRSYPPPSEAVMIARQATQAVNAERCTARTCNLSKTFNNRPRSISADCCRKPATCKTKKRQTQQRTCRYSGCDSLSDQKRAGGGA